MLRLKIELPQSRTTLNDLLKFFYKKYCTNIFKYNDISNVTGNDSNNADLFFQILA